MSQTTAVEHISLKELPPHVISYLSSYPPSERCKITKKLLAYAVSKIEQKSESLQEPNRHYQPSDWWSHEEYRRKKKNKKSSGVPIEDRFPKRMVDEMTQTSDAYVRTPEKMPKGTRGYKKLFAEPPRHKLLGHKKLIGSEFEKTTVISDPFFVASIKKSGTNFLKKQQQTKRFEFSPRSPPTPQTPTQIYIVKPDKHQSTHLLKHKRTVKLASKNSSKGKDKATPRSPPKVKYKTTVEIADEFLESTFMAYLEPPPKEDDDLERNNDLEEIIYKARQKYLVPKCIEY
ncbi:unnamed protein product [Rhizophagus irregularis]|uniref:Uncharacterized protein n=1 Tax=Rhizophagus irregularis TaxID=588596 RepID=A0A915ZH53_9GLOM|nr:unnamed protein product [Rhizophagus irregularis]CAB5192690.1 unnamed protein product [Rhizophagus irregularis]CAB5357606.1 unnamed protein product [Rhizophagus irregularis]CAB5376485.1 unnamed protein product [Rhizophagus irregularis]